MTTAQTYQTDDDQLAPAHDQAIPQDSPAETEATLTAPEPDLTEPDTDLATAEPGLAEPDAEPMVPEADLADLAEPTEPDAEPMVPEAGLADLAEPTEPMVPEADMAVPEAYLAVPEMADSSPGSPSLVSGAFTVPESDTDARPAGDTASAAGPWNEIQAMFVDDPRASIERAAGLVDARAEELIQSVRERQRSIQSAWQADDAGTEELRVALQHYRSFWTSLEELPAQT
jgi:hypothetical protein